MLRISIACCLFALFAIANTETVSSPPEMLAAKCTGSDPCLACRNCHNCGHCKAGGSCGACKKKKTMLMAMQLCR